MAFNFIPGETVQVPELSFKTDLVLSPSETALLIVDMQNDFVKASGSLQVASASETIKPIRELLQRARKSDMKIVYTQDTQFEGDKEFEIWPEHCLQGSEGWQIIDELKPREQDLICPKNRYDGFYGTWLEHYLSRVWKIKNLVIVGTVANICVLHTAASAGLRWFHVVVPANGISALTEFDQAMTLRQVSWLYAGDIVQACDQIQFE